MMDWYSTLTNFSWIWEEPNFEEASFLSKEEMLIYYSPRVFHSIQATILLKNDVNVSSFGHCWNPWNCAKVSTTTLLPEGWHCTKFGCISSFVFKMAQFLHFCPRVCTTAGNDGVWGSWHSVQSTFSKRHTIVWKMTLTIDLTSPLALYIPQSLLGLYSAQ